MEQLQDLSVDDVITTVCLLFAQIHKLKLKVLLKYHVNSILGIFSLGLISCVTIKSVKILFLSAGFVHLD